MFTVMKFIFVTVVFITTAAEVYHTNFLASLKWDDEIAYGTVSDYDEEAFQNFVTASILRFTDKFNSPLNWTYFSDDTRLYHFDRYVVFFDTGKACGDAYSSYIGPSSIHLSNNSVICGEDEPLGLILRVLGFMPMTKRVDRDDHINLIWDNITPQMETLLQKMPQLNDTEDPAFKVYDFNSIMHISIHSPYAINPEMPIWTVKTNLSLTSNNSKKFNRFVTENDIKQFQAIYKH